jgi:DNA-directed RNA polymerase
MMEKNEQAGRADNNPYARPLYRRYVLPLRDMIAEAVKETGKPGRRAAHIALLKPLDPASVAFIAIRNTLVFATTSNVNARELARNTGTAVYRELVLAAFENMQPELYWEICHDIERRRSKDSRYKYRVVRDSANSRDIELPDWTPGEREQVGLWLIEAQRELGLVDVERRVEKKLGGIREKFELFLSDDARSTVNSIKELVEETMPWAMPCIEPPKPWTAFNKGGYHTNEMRRWVPYCVNVARQGKREAIDVYRNADLSVVRGAINTLQNVRWQVNREMLDTIRTVAKHFDMDEVLTQAELPKPKAPEWLRSDMKKEDMTADQLNEFAAWKRRAAEWYTQMKLRGQKWGRFYTATRVADKFKDYDAIHFVYQADFRGRLYAVTTGISPQGSDLQKALLRFADGKPLATDDAVRWFKVNGANRFGVDKVPFADRIKWVDDNDRHIIAFADDPVSNAGWTEADSPLQFLAWAKEYAEWRRNPSGFVSRIPVGLDGSCNGLQHFSAMLRDSVGGRATNLLPAAAPNDIYQQVADVVKAKLADLKLDQLSERDQELAKKWIAHGMNRKLVKRSVMTLPYGSTRYSCAEFIVADYLRQGEAPEFERSQYIPAANFLSHIVWDAIGEVVIAASQAMSWLQKAASTLIKSGQSQIRWVTPSGFPVVQVYNEVEIVRINSLLLGGVRLKVGTTGDKPDVNKHKNGLSPNFVHSMDASHLALTVQACEKAGIDSLAMIHDDYGTHAADAQQLFGIIRDTFVRMYETNDPLNWFRAHYDGLPAVPESGDLDIGQVRKSPYFFA